MPEVSKRDNKPMESQATIIQLGNPILRKKAKPVKNINDKKIQKIIDDLLTIVTKVNGVGLSAPQVGKSFQVFIIASHPNPRYPNAPKMKPTPVINPKIISFSKKIIKDWEGCLSIPGIRGLVPRSDLIFVEYLNRRGKKEQKRFTGFIARIFQHEYNHLKGIVFLDRVESSRDIITESEYQKLIKINKKQA